MLALVLAGVLAADGGEPDAGAPFSGPLYSTCPVADAPLELDGGAVLLSSARASRNACLMATCEARRGQLEASPAQPFSAVALGFAVAMGVLGLALGAWGGWAFAHFLDGR